MANLTIQQSDTDGLAASYAAAAAGGDTFANSGDVLLHVKNEGGGSVTVTVSAVTACNQGTLHDSVTSVAAGAERFIGPFDPAFFGTAPDISYSGVSSVTVAAIRA